MNKNKIPTILGLFLLVIGIAAGVVLVQNRQFFGTEAEEDITPKDVRITNITESSFSVSWITDGETSGFVKYGETANSLGKTDLDEIEGNSTVHYSTIQGLESKTEYFFKINSGARDFDNNGIAWQVLTGASLPDPSSRIVSGNVVSASGTPVANALVHVSVGGASPLSTTTSGNGSWLINLDSARDTSLSTYATIDETNSVIEISIQAGALGISTAQIYPQSASSIPTMVLGQVHDYKNLPPNSNADLPEASVDLPDEATKSSGFEVDNLETPEQEESVTLESVDSGEVITTESPEFFGEGPPGTEITILIESDPITDSLTVGSSGEWNWSPPENLPEGPHTITISWKDASGILRTLKRSFVVQASEGPSFESTPSASTTPSPTPTASTSPSPSVTPTPTATPEELVDAGTLTPTYLLTIMGLALLTVSGVLGYLALDHARRE